MGHICKNGNCGSAKYLCFAEQGRQLFSLSGHHLESRWPKPPIPPPPRCPPLGDVPTSQPPSLVCRRPPSPIRERSSGACGRVGTRAQGRGQRALPQTAGSSSRPFPGFPFEPPGPARLLPIGWLSAALPPRYQLAGSVHPPWKRWAGRTPADSLAPTANGHRPIKEGLNPPRCRAREGSRVRRSAAAVGGGLATGRAGPGAKAGGGRGGGDRKGEWRAGS